MERKSYKRRDYEITSGTIEYIVKGNVYVESKINHSTKVNWTYKLRMDYPTDEEYEWLEQLVYSPQMYMEIEDGFYPVTIKNTNYEHVKHTYAGLKALELDIEMNQKRFAFKR